MTTGGRCAAFTAGSLFAAGVVLSRMIDPAKVLGFLDIAGDWDPSLIFVMATAIPVAWLGIRLVARRRTSLIGTALAAPAGRPIDARLIGGALLFGAGWGLVGYCPGPALAALGNGARGTAVFVLAMLAGMALFRLLPARGQISASR